MLQTKKIEVQRGNNIGKAIINSFHNYSKVQIRTLQVARDTINKVNTATITYTH